MIEAEKKFRAGAVEQIAKLMALAARTAPKAKGLDLLEIVVLSGEDVVKLSAKMKEIGDREKHPTFLRDAENVRQAQAVLLLGSRKQTVGLKYCSYCGWPNCAESEKAGALCAYNSGDLGIAVGSAVAVAANHHLDNRVMYTVGKAALEMGLLGEAVIAYGIPLSVSAKNPFFDRK